MNNVDENEKKVEIHNSSENEGMGPVEFLTKVVPLVAIIVVGLIYGVGYLEKKNLESKIATDLNILSAKGKIEQLSKLSYLEHPSLRKRILHSLLHSSPWDWKLVEKSLQENLFTKSEIEKISYFILGKEINLPYSEMIFERISSDRYCDSYRCFRNNYENRDAKFFHEILTDKFIDYLDDYDGERKSERFSKWGILFPEVFAELKIEEKVKKFKKIKSEFNGYKEKLKELKEKIEKDKEDLFLNKQDVENAEHIRGFMVARLKGGISSERYEISVLRGAYDRPSMKNRAILDTTKTKFSSKGHFQMWVRNVGDQKVVTTERSGGFHANWPIYREIPNYYELSNSLKSLKEGISYSEKKIEELKGDIENIKVRVAEI
jgi:hypothetical protein